ncbi:uncharacterized protein LOC131605929 [Vicia villosa]|uniref:uncharacterized protein LOC131605928 n=1 Tax=Vicia villosa TaxID=3911 RepID=UPI00273C6B37|nr:uncharacterized protein LOC131605928 [Vicia villosa]XP_058734200.1 uncharacterized protein LOC131605929 [Vicia villosa]
MVFMDKMTSTTAFKYHSKCAKIGITHLAFVDDVLLFSRGETQSVQIMMNTFQQFSDSTGLSVNPQKCQIFYSGMEEETINKVHEMTGYGRGTLPVRYLGVPLASKRVSTNHYLPLIERILSRIRHWSSNLLSIAGRILLVKSIFLAITQYWMMCFPIPKTVIHKIEAICRAFVWTGTDKSRKSPIAWTRVCSSIKNGGMNLIHMETWNRVAMLRCLWSLSLKVDSLWVKWVHAYYIKHDSVWNINLPQNVTWILKDIMARREDVSQHMQFWEDMQRRGKFAMKKLYDQLTKDDTIVQWSHVIQHNGARPRAIVCLWLVCHNRLATKSRLKRLGLLQEETCSLCMEQPEDINHLIIDCKVTRHIWLEVLQWLELHHHPVQWQEEIAWIIHHTKGKSFQSYMLKIAIAETVYGIWKYRNERIFGTNVNVDTNPVVSNIIDSIVVRGWIKVKHRKSIALLMM